MNSTPNAIRYRRLRAPREHGVTLIDPPLESVPRRVAENIALADTRRYDCQGRSLNELARQARHELIEAAVAYTSAYRDVDVPGNRGDDLPILLTGHQPALYHAGVWFKNFALSFAAGRLGAHAVHLLVDNDTFRAAAIRVPQGTPGDAKARFVAFDQPCEGVPHEERRIQDPSTFASFPDRVRRCLGSTIEQPIVNQLWPLARQAADRSKTLGRVLSEARHRLEAQWGLSTCELPLSEVCQREPFRWFAAHLLAQLPSFREIYNSSLADYRRVHRIRSRTHPVPELAQQGEWLEAPFWIWSADQPRRQRLFVRGRGRELELSDLNRSLAVLPLDAERNAESAVEQLGELASRGVRLRPRALITTMFARLFLCDLFFHGIGGAKYDQLTDSIIERFFHARPPDFLVLTATAKLPIQRPRVSEEDLRRTEGLLRDLRYNPQRHVALSEQTRPLVLEKQRWIQDAAASVDRRLRHREIVRINASLQPYLESRRQELLGQRERSMVLLGQDRVLASREYSFCLFPEATLRPLLLDF